LYGVEGWVGAGGSLLLVVFVAGSVNENENENVRGGEKGMSRDLVE
jgi:hypothetical protein